MDVQLKIGPKRQKMKKLEDLLNYVNIAPFWNYGAIVFTTFAAKAAAEGNWEKFIWNAGIMALYTGLGYLDFKSYKELKTELENGWDEKKVDEFVNKSTLFSKHIAKRASKQTGYYVKFDDLAKRKNYKILNIFNSGRYLSDKL